MYKSLFLLAIFFGLYSLDASASRGLFGSSEKLGQQMTSFPKWENALVKYNREMISPSCNDDYSRSCILYNWLSFLESIKDYGDAKKLDLVNRYSNEHPYIIDRVNWGVEDYWESPGEFLIKSGDCEDYAIIKYMSLVIMGFNPNNLRVVVLQDNNLNVLHSVLAVYLEDKIYILDNQISKVTEDTKIYHYKPIYSINYNQWWRHY